MTADAMHPNLLTDAEWHATGDPHALWRWMRTQSPVHWHPAAALPGFWSVTRYADVRAIYSDPVTFSSASGVLLRPVRYGEDPGGGLTLALTDPPRHRELRALIADQFSTRHARSIGNAIRADVRSVLARAAEQGECDVAHDIGIRLSTLLICRLMGIYQEDFEDLIHWATEAFDAGKPLTGHLPIMQYFIDLMYDRMGARTEDIAGLLANGTIGGRELTETEILLNFENLVGATENAGLSIAGGMQALAQHPEQLSILRERQDLLPTAVEEILRWTSSAVHSMRTATRPCVINSHEIEAGDRVVVWLPSANRDESVFDQPYSFNLDRRPNRHLALGFGEHVCIGGTMARAQLRILLTELLDSVEAFELAGPAVPLRSIAVKGPAHLPMRLTMRRRSRADVTRHSR